MPDQERKITSALKGFESILLEMQDVTTTHISNQEDRLKEQILGAIEEFQREEIRSDQKFGWCIDDLWKDAELKMNAGGEYEEREPEELDFG